MKSRSLAVLACLSAFIWSIEGVAQPPNPALAPPKNTAPQVPNPAAAVPNPAAQPNVPNPAARPNPANPATTPPTARPNPAAPGNPKPNGTAPAKTQGGKEEELKPQVLSLNTRDGVKLRCVYFPSDRAKKAIPIIIVHEMGGQSAPYVTSLPNERVPSIALQLQRAGFAVICADLRGHGGSLTQANNPKELDRTRFGKKDVMAIINDDMETVKNFLRDENDAGKLNLNALVLMGIQDGCVIAMNWAAVDWAWPTIPGKKQGQDVKALVLVSPVKLLEGVTYEPLLKNSIVAKMPLLIMAGETSPEAEEAQRLDKILGKLRSGSNAAGAGVLEVKLIPTAVSGPRLLGSDAAPKSTLAFLTQNVAEKLDSYPWVKRSK